MNFLNKMERKFGRFAIPNLTLFLIGSYIIGYIFSFVNAEMMSWLTLNPFYILKGQVWRIFTWILVPPEQLSIFTIIMLFFYYSLGTNLERTWGTFRYNFYIFGGLILTVVGAFLLYFVYDIFIFAGDKDTIGLLAEMGAYKEYGAGTYHQVMGIIYESIFFNFSTYYINLSIFLAFAASYPEKFFAFISL